MILAHICDAPGSATGTGCDKLQEQLKLVLESH
jgi:hypothetical protein